MDNIDLVFYHYQMVKLKRLYKLLMISKSKYMIYLLILELQIQIYILKIIRLNIRQKLTKIQSIQ